MRRLHIALGVAVTLLVLAAGATVVEPAVDPHTRGLSSASCDLIAQARHRSTIVTSLIEALDRTDVVVYVQLAPFNRADAFGNLTFLTAAGGFRYVVVKIDWLAIGHDQIVALAHELQHALEIAAAPEVRDADTFAAFYGRIGWPVGPGKFETELARQTGRRAERELAGFGTEM